MKLTRKTALKIARLTDQGKYQEIIDILSAYPADKKGSWGYVAKKLIPFLKDITSPAPFTIFAEGNSKLPFYSFSNLPLVNCPGKGECAKWCYSLKAWRYPAAFFRQIQNTILVREQSTQIRDAWLQLPANSDVRLYVDGDFDSLKTMHYWFGLLNVRPDLKVYGYSKSWEIFIEYHQLGLPFPKNYVLNLSSGSKYQNIGPIRAAMKALPITRGEFIAIPAGKHPEPKTIREIAKSFGMQKLFVCPGKCGFCLPKQGKNIHACGSMLLENTNILIGTH
jgi:hypothetical protein